MNSGNTIPRELIKWLDSLDLAYSVRNVRRDMANGFIVAEILSRFYPKEVNIYSFGNGLKKDQRKDNWEQISKLLSKKDFEVSVNDYEAIYNQAENAAYQFLCRLYEFLAHKKLNLEKKPKINKSPESIPSYAKPTANALASNRELVRIVDQDQKHKKTLAIIDNHNETVRKEKQDSNIIEYLVMKRRQQLEEQLRREEEALLERKRKYSQPEVAQPEIKEIQLKSYNSSTSKKNKEQQGQLTEAKGFLELLQGNASSIQKKDAAIDKELQKLGIDKKPQIISEIFNRCEEVSKKTMKTFLFFLQEKQQFQDIYENLNNNFLDFKKFFYMFLHPMQYLKYTSKTLTHIYNLIKMVAAQLVLMDAQTTQLMFEQILLKEYLQIVIKFPNKRDQVCDLFFYFCAANSTARLHLFKKMKEILGTDLQSFISILASLITQDYHGDFDEELYNLFYYYSITSLDSPSPIMRVNGLKIINEISLYNYQRVLARLDKLNKHINDNWWEVNAQILIICSNLLLFLAQEDDQFAASQVVVQSMHKKKSQSEEQQAPQQHQQKVQNNINLKANEVVLEVPQEEEKERTHLDDVQSVRSERIYSQNQNPDLQTEKQQQVDLRRQKQKHLLDIVYHIFLPKTSQNILRIGLIYLAPALNFYTELCDRYLEILLEISDKIRETVLMTNPPTGMEEGQIVRGCFSFQYKLTSAPVTWNSVGIAQAMDKYVKQVQLQNFEKEHLEILFGCLYNKLEDKDSQTWINIYENLKKHIFLALLDRELCALASDILKKIFLFETIQQTVLVNSKSVFLYLLTLVYQPDNDQACKDNLLDLFEFLNQEKELFKTYTYDIIKEFSEKSKNLFLRSNLIEFMNNLAKERRSKLHDVDIFQ